MGEDGAWSSRCNHPFHQKGLFAHVFTNLQYVSSVCYWQGTMSDNVGSDLWETRDEPDWDSALKKLFTLYVKNTHISVTFSLSLYLLEGGWNPISRKKTSLWVDQARTGNRRVAQSSPWLCPGDTPWSVMSHHRWGSGMVLSSLWAPFQGLLCFCPLIPPPGPFCFGCWLVLRHRQGKAAFLA